jgi:POLQ-like helicase
MSSRSLANTWPYPRHMAFEKQLRTAAQNWFKNKGYPVRPKMPYLLDSWDNWSRNIILPEVADYVKKERAERATIKGFPLHKYIHHGLSSQAMLFNLIGPLIVRQDLNPLRLLSSKMPYSSLKDNSKLALNMKIAKYSTKILVNRLRLI